MEANNNIINMFTKKNIEEDAEVLHTNNGLINLSPFNETMSQEVLESKVEDAIAISLKAVQSLFNMIEKHYETNYENVHDEEFVLLIEALKSLILKTWGIDHPLQEASIEIIDLDDSYDMDIVKFFTTNYTGVNDEG